MPQAIIRAAYVLLLPSFVSAYSFSINESPQQCRNLSISITGVGQPPYRLLVIPSGPTPLPNNIEARTIIDQPFEGNSTSLSFQLKYPQNSQFVAVVSDSTGFGSGGTSVAAQVLSSSDATCFNSTQSVSPQFVFSMDLPNQLVQCNATRIYWDPNTVQGNVNFLGVIPGGQSFTVPQTGGLSTVPNEGAGFSWTPSLRGGTTVILVGGDGRGLGSGGSILLIVGFGQFPTTSCLDNSSPSSTPGSPAGGSYPTSANGGTTGNTGGGRSTNVGAIVGGVIGGVAGLVIILLGLFFLRRYRRLQKIHKERPVDLLQDDDDDRPNRNEQLPPFYQPEPFIVPEPTVTEVSSAPGLEDAGARSRRVSGLTNTTTDFRSGTPDFGPAGAASSTHAPSSYAQKSATRLQLRPVNIIQHDDAGPSEAGEPPGEPETVELPPAYTHIRK